MSSDPAECPEPAESSERMMPWRHRFACSFRAVRRCGERASIAGRNLPLDATFALEGRPLLVPRSETLRRAPIEAAVESSGLRVGQNRLRASPRADLAERVARGSQVAHRLSGERTGFVLDD